MMYYLDNGNIINSIEGLQDNVSNDIYNAIEGLHNEVVNDINENLECCKYELNCYELRLDDTKSQLYDANNILQELEEYILNSKRINRNVIIEYIKGLKSSIEKLLYYLGKETDIDVSRDSIQIKEQFYSVLKEKNLEKLHPEVAEQWDFDKNGKITPSMVGAESPCML